MAADEIPACAVQLGDVSRATHTVYYTRTGEICPGASETAGHADDVDGLIHILPFATESAHAI
jgi:hypothetical protein